MSVEAIAWAIQQDVQTPGAKLLLLVLANGANEHGVTWIGRKLQATRCCCQEGTVTANMKRLEELGMVARVQRRRKNGSRTSDYVILAPNADDRGSMQDANPEEVPEEVGLLAVRGQVRKTNLGSGKKNDPSQVRKTGGPDPLEEPLALIGEHNSEQPTLDSEEEARIERFLSWFRTKVETHRGEPLPRFGKGDREAARDIIRRHPDPHEVEAVLDTGLADHRWYGPKIKSPKSFRQFYGDLRVKWVGQQAGRAQAEEIAARRNGDRVDQPFKERLWG